ncbi:MAG: hypothetical protein ACI4RT_01740 [Candidatus Spyradenecus sp.]
MKFDTKHGNDIKAFKREDGLYDLYLNGARVSWCHEEELETRADAIDCWSESFLDCAIKGGYVKYL